LGFPSGTAKDDQGAPNGSMGLAACDFNGSGRPAIWVANYENELHALYRNDCVPDPTDRQKDRIVFTYFTQPAGLAVFGRMTVGWGTGFFDIDHHGAEDMFLVTGHATRVPKTSPRAQRPILARNEGGRFKDIVQQGGSYFTSYHVARGAVQADFDNDGRVDIAVIHTNEPVAVLRNVADTKGRHWLGLQVTGKDRGDAVGAKIVLEAGGKKQTRFVQSGGSYCSSSDRRHVLGLGAADRIDKLTVIWPDGKEQPFAGLKLDRYYRLSEGATRAEPLYEKKR
jgi:hypothetical protein